MEKQTEMQIEESYKNFKPYLKNDLELRGMCLHCECYMGPKHDHEDCLDMMCFRFYLAYKYLEWLNSSDGY